MQTILLVSGDTQISLKLADLISEKKEYSGFKLEVCEDFVEAEQLINNKDFFAVVIDTDICENLCLEIHKLSFLARHEIYVLGIGRSTAYEDIARLIKCGLSDFISTDDIVFYIEELLNLALRIFAIDKGGISAFKKLFRPDSLEQIILSSLLHEVRNNNNIASLNTEMIRSILKRTKDTVDAEQKDEICQYAERAFTGTLKSSEMVEIFSYVHKLKETPAGSVSDFASSLENVQKCFSHRFQRLYSEVKISNDFKVPYLKINQRDVYKVLMNMFYLACLSLGDISSTLEIKVFGNKNHSGFSLAFSDAFLYKVYFDDDCKKRVFLPEEYICCLDILKGFVSLYGGSFSLEETKDNKAELKFCFSPKIYYV